MNSVLSAFGVREANLIMRRSPATLFSKEFINHGSGGLTGGKIWWKIDRNA